MTTGLGTGTQKTTGGYDFRQGLEDALAGTFDGEASQKVTRGIGLLERALGDVRAFDDYWHRGSSVCYGVS